MTKEERDLAVDIMNFVAQGDDVERPNGAIVATSALPARTFGPDKQVFGPEGLRCVLMNGDVYEIGITARKVPR